MRHGHRKYWGVCRTARSGSSVHLRQVKRESAAGSCRATQLNLAAKKVRQFAADCETETGPAIFPACARIRLLERFKNDALFFSRDTDAGIRHLESDDSFGSTQDGMVRSPASLRFQNGQTHLPLFGELKGIRKEIFEHLLEAFRVSYQALAQRRVGERLKRKPAIFRFVPEGPGNHFEQTREEYFFGLDGNGAGFDFRQIENVAD